MNASLPYLKIIRPQNALLAGAAVALGFWLGHSALSPFSLILLVASAIAATGFGNVVNDLQDISTDRISHPDRPLPRGDIPAGNALIYAWCLAVLALLSSVFVSTAHLVATVVPLLLLLLYTRFLKATPLAGNVVVSLLVAYALLFGGLKSPEFNRLIIPALLAFLLNLSREIIKDLEDKPGDTAAGIRTTAVLPLPVIRFVAGSIAAVYFALLFMPRILYQFGNIYAIICAFIVVPLQIIWLALFFKKGPQLSIISLLIKVEMAAGLLALAADKFFLK